jgi:hypothetical protein
MSAYTPFPSTSSRDADENDWWLSRELSLIKNLLEDRGELSRSEIGDTLGCKYWARCASATRSRRASSAASSGGWAAAVTRRPAEPTSLRGCPRAAA